MSQIGGYNVTIDEKVIAKNKELKSKVLLMLRLAKTAYFVASLYKKIDRCRIEDETIRVVENISTSRLDYVSIIKDVIIIYTGKLEEYK